MFNFFKKKPKESSLMPVGVLSEDEIATIQTQLAEKKQQLFDILKQDNPSKTIIAKQYEEMGLIVARLDTDQAINYLENSLSHQLTIGDGYKKLMSLYNQKRAEAAQHGDGEGIDKWMNKMDDMRQIAKQVIITG